MGILADDSAGEDFAYHVSKAGRLFISWRGKTVMTLKDDEARRFLARLAGLSQQEAQLALAKITGNFKRGNERRGAG